MVSRLAILLLGIGIPIVVSRLAMCCTSAPDTPMFTLLGFSGREREMLLTGLNLLIELDEVNGNDCPLAELSAADQRKQRLICTYLTAWLTREIIAYCPRFYNSADRPAVLQNMENLVMCGIDMADTLSYPYKLTLYDFVRDDYWYYATSVIEATDQGVYSQLISSQGHAVTFTPGNIGSTTDFELCQRFVNIIECIDQELEQI